VEVLAVVLGAKNDALEQFQRAAAGQIKAQHKISTGQIELMRRPEDTLVHTSRRNLCFVASLQGLDAYQLDGKILGQCLR
jgi:hypothetical protein